MSACLRHPAPEKAGLAGEWQVYAEESTLEWVASGGAVPVVLPRSVAGLDASDVVAAVDGLVLHGGADVAPESYGEEPERPEWAGDRARDLYELALLGAARAQRKPVFGICRGAQLVNVAFGGTLHQDVAGHRGPDDELGFGHPIRIDAGSWLDGWYAGDGSATDRIVNSVHHQALKRIGDGLVVEARAPDGTAEAVRAADGSWLFAVQWHPEYMHATGFAGLDPAVLLGAFLEECRRSS